MRHLFAIFSMFLVSSAAYAQRNSADRGQMERLSGMKLLPWSSRKIKINDQEQLFSSMQLSLYHEIP
jgi:hypothetical protein